MQASPRPIGRVADGVLTLVLSAALALFALLMTLVGPVVGMASDVCGSDGYRCAYGQIGTGTLLAAFGPAVVAAAVIIAVVVLRRRGRLTWPLALLGAAAVLGVAMLGQALVGWAIVRG